MVAAPLHLRHQRLAHYHYGWVRELDASKVVSGVQVTTYKQLTPRCLMGAPLKFTRLPFPLSNIFTTSPMQPVHTNVIGHVRA